VSTAWAYPESSSSAGPAGANTACSRTGASTPNATPAITERIHRLLTSPATPTGPEGARPDPTPTIHPPPQRATAGPAGMGVLLAAATAVPAFTRLGIWSGMTFAAVAVAGTALAVGVPRATRWAVRTTVARLAAQPVIALAAAWQLYAGVPASKADELRRLGVRPELGAAANLAYPALGTTVFAWLAVRCRRRNRAGADNEAKIRNCPTTVGTSPAPVAASPPASRTSPHDRHDRVH
jgi:hypothetical protein